MAAEHELALWAADPALARKAADAAIADVQRIEAKYSRYRDDSLTSRINRAAGGAAGRDRRRDGGAAALRRRVPHAERGSLRHHVRRAAARVELPAGARRDPGRRRARRPHRADRLGRGRVGRAVDPSAARRHGDRLRRHRQGVRRRPRRDDLPRARHPARPREPGRRSARDRSAGRRHAVARRHPPSAPRGRCGRRLRSRRRRARHQRRLRALRGDRGAALLPHPQSAHRHAGRALAVGERRSARCAWWPAVARRSRCCSKRGRRRSSRRRTSRGSPWRRTARCTATRWPRRPPAPDAGQRNGTRRVPFSIARRLRAATAASTW